MAQQVSNHCHVSFVGLLVFCVSGEGGDFIVTSVATQTFTSGSTASTSSLCISINIVEDDVYEENEEFTVSINSVSPFSAAMVGAPDNVTKTIQDNQGLCTALEGVFFSHFLPLLRCCGVICAGWIHYK